MNLLCRAANPFAARLYSYLKRGPVPPFPRKVFIETTSRCNLRCPICPRDQMKRQEGDMDLALFEKVADELSEQDAKRALVLVGLHFFGDPVMHPQLLRMIDYLGDRVPNLRSLGAERDPLKGIGMNTNGLFLTEENTRGLLDSKLTWLGVAVDATNPETYQRVHGSKQFERLVENIERLLRLNAQKPRDLPNVGLQMIETPGTAREVAEFRRHWEPRIAKMPNMRIYVKQYTTWAGRVESANNSGADDSWFVHKACAYPFEMLVVCSDGSVAPCCYDMDCSMNLGSVKEQTLAEIWRVQSLIDLRADMTTGTLGGYELCRNCHHARYNLRKGAPPAEV